MSSFRKRNIFLLLLAGLFVGLTLVYFRAQNNTEDTADVSPAAETSRTSSISGIPSIDTRNTNKENSKASTQTGGFSDFVDDTTTEQLLEFQRRRAVSGTVYESISANYWEDYFAQLETAGSKKEFNQILKNMKPIQQPAADVLVTIKSGSFTAKQVSDSEGRYNFIGLPQGPYSISCKKSVSDTMGQERVGYAKKTVKIDSDRKVNLNLRPDYVTVRGRITNVNGEPVGGVRIKGVLAPFPHTGNPESSLPQAISGISGIDGSYTLSGFDAPNFVAVSQYLISKTSLEDIRYPGFCVDIYVSSEEITLSKDNAKRVPLVTEETLYQARRLLNAYSKIAQGNELEKIKEKEDLPLPSSHDNIITGINIVLD